MKNITLKIPIKQKITRGKFRNLDMRVAKIISAPLVEDTNSPCRLLKLDAGYLGVFTSVGQFALVDEKRLVDRKVIIVCNLSPHTMGNYISEVLTLGTPHPNSLENKGQAIPIYADDLAQCGDIIF